MKVSELLEADIIKGPFGSGSKSDIEIPRGFKSFFVRQAGTAAYSIYGVKDDGSEHKISTTSSKELADALAKEYNSGGHGGTGLKKASLLSAFGSVPLNILHDAGIHFLEKPNYWEDLERASEKYHPLSEIELKKVKNLLAKAGIKLKEYSAKDLWDKEPRGPLVKPLNSPQDTIFIVKLDNGNRYLVDKSGATSYFRMWALIKG
jgi:hypothetical protein